LIAHVFKTAEIVCVPSIDLIKNIEEQYDMSFLANDKVECTGFIAAPVMSGKEDGSVLGVIFVFSKSNLAEFFNDEDVESIEQICDVSGESCGVVCIVICLCCVYFSNPNA